MPYPPHGGVRQRSYNLMRKIAEKNDLHLVAFNQHALINNDKDLYLAKQEFLKFCKSVDVHDIPSNFNKLKWYWLVFSSLFNYKPQRLKWTYSKKFREEIRRKLKELNADLIHVDTIGLLQNLDIINRNSSVVTVLNHHNIESHMMFRRFRTEKNIFKKTYFYIEALKLQRLEKKFCGIFDLNLVVSDLDKKRLVEINSEIQVAEAPNGVDVHYFSPMNLEQTPNTLIFAASMDWYPNHHAMIWFVNNVWPSLKVKIPAMKLIIAGRNPQKSLQKLCSGDTDIQLTGFVDDIRPIIEKASIYICPILDGGGTKLKLLDAMAMEKAIVSTTFGSEGLNVENNRNILIADSPEEFVNKIMILNKDLEMRKQLGKNARDLAVREYSWEKIGRDVNELYEKFVFKPEVSQIK